MEQPPAQHLDDDIQKLFIGPLPLEEWKPVANYENLYSISNLGRVYGVKRKKILRQFKDLRGKQWVSLCQEGKRKSHLVANLIAAAFIGPAPEGLVAVRGPLGEAYSGVENLSYEPDPLIDRCNRPKLTREQVLEIRARYQERGLSLTKTAEQYGVSIPTIHHIIKRNIWKHV